MKTSAAGRAAIARREGRRLFAYRDARGILTIGVGHTGRMSPPSVTAGMTIDAATCDSMLARDLAPVEAAIEAAVRVPLSQNEFDALASLGFNIGTAGLARSSALRRLNRGDIVGAADAFLAWSRPASLAARRHEERAQFLAPDETRTPALAQARAEALTERATTVRTQARTTAIGGAATLVVGSGLAGASVVGPHRPHLGFALLGIVIAGTALDALVVWLRRRCAADLASRAAAQTRPAAPSIQTHP